jgi:hypothetical protein
VQSLVDRLPCTYLIDGNALVHWYDVSFELFLNADFLVYDSKHLLAPIKPAARVLAADSL